MCSLPRQNVKLGNHGKEMYKKAWCTYKVVVFRPPHPCKGIQDSLRFRIPRRGLGILITGFQIFFSETWIPDSYSCFSDSKAQDSGFQEEKFTRFRIPRRKIPRFRNPDSLTWGDCFANLNQLLFCRSCCLRRRCCLSSLYNNATRHHIFYRKCRRACSCVKGPPPYFRVRIWEKHHGSHLFYWPIKQLFWSMLTYRFFRALFSLFFLYNSYSVQGLAWCLECFLYSPRRQYFPFLSHVSVVWLLLWEPRL